MNQAYHILKKLLYELGIQVPNSKIMHLLDTPVGNTIRGISDALDSLNIENNVYNLQGEYLCKLKYPYLMAFPHRKKRFAVITNAEEREKALPDWEGIILTAQTTDSTLTYKYVRLKNIKDALLGNPLTLLLLLFLTFAFLGKCEGVALGHALLSCLGLLVSVLLMKKEYSDSVVEDSYCKIGKYVDCESVLNSKGSNLLGFLRLSDMSFLFFLIQIILATQPGLINLNSGFYLALIGCLFTFYSVVYQIAIIRKLCLYCLTVCLLVWIDTALLGVVIDVSADLVYNIYNLLYSGIIAIAIWVLSSRYLRQTRQMASERTRLSMFYRKDLFEWLLSKEKSVDDLDDSLTDIYNTNGKDVITMFVHPKCKYCKKLLGTIPTLASRFKLRIVSLATRNSKILDYCKKNGIRETPTIVFNNRILPDIFQVEDLEYIV